MLETLWQDLRHGMRVLAKNPGFTLIATLSIAIGVGANAAMFSVADGLVLRPLAVPDADNLLVVSGTTPTGAVVGNGVSYPDYRDLRDRARSFTGLAATRGVLASFASHRDDAAQARYGLAVSGNFFDVIGVRPVLGRAFVAEDDRVEGRHPVVVLGHDTWTMQFGGDRDVIGREIRLTGHPFTVVGIAPPDFTVLGIYAPPIAFYIPTAMLPTLDVAAAPDMLQRRDVRMFQLFGRLKPDVSLAQAVQDVQIVSAALQREHPATNERYGLLLQRERAAFFNQYWGALVLGLMLMGLAVAVLLVACANVAGLLSSRAPARAREIAVRIAMGGGRLRLIRQLITESAIIAVAGGIVGLGLAELGIRSFEQFQPASNVGILLDYELDRRALLVGLAIAAIGALLSSAVPAWRSTRIRDLSNTLRNATTSSQRAGRLWGRHGLVVSQVALTLVLLTVAVAFYRSFQAEYGRGPGFRTDHLLLVDIDPALARYDARQSDAFYQRVKERAAASSGATAAALTSFVPMNQNARAQIGIVPEGFELPVGLDSLQVMTARVDEAYFDVIGVPIVGGRGFLTTDTFESPRVAVVSRGLADTYWRSENPIGKRLRLMGGEDAWAEVVGIAADSKVRLFVPASTPMLYLPRLQHPSTAATLLVKTAGHSHTMAAEVRAMIEETDPNVPILAMQTMEAYYDASAKTLNTVAVRTIAGMGAMGLLLALVGLYGLTAYAVSRRTREIGIRMAVGALPSSMLLMVLRQGMLPAVIGVGCGVAASWAVGNLIERTFPNTSADATTYLLIIPLVVAVILLAAYLPARRAAHIDPLLALRQE